MLHTIDPLVHSALILATISYVSRSFPTHVDITNLHMGSCNGFLGLAMILDIWT
jgi:hypothetical protein